MNYKDSTLLPPSINITPCKLIPTHHPPLDPALFLLHISMQAQYKTKFESRLVCSLLPLKIVFDIFFYLPKLIIFLANTKNKNTVLQYTLFWIFIKSPCVNAFSHKIKLNLILICTTKIVRKIKNSHFHF